MDQKISHRDRWQNLRNILTRSGPFRQSGLNPSMEVYEKLRSVKVLILGAGGLGCEILKNLSMMGFQNLHIIDMDRVDLSNLNRQFLFKRKDIGYPKAEVAAEAIRRRVPGCMIKPYYNNIEDFDQDFYLSFDIIISGLDTITARRWMNAMLLSLLNFDEENDELDYSTVIPFIDGGTEGLKGSSRNILPGISSCFDCTIDLYPSQAKYNPCTLASTPRLPEHCVEYVKLILWARENPWGKCTLLDEDDPNHLTWIYEKSLERAKQYGIFGITYGLVQGVVKNIMPAVASTNAVIAAACVTEVFKIVTDCVMSMTHFLLFNAADGIYVNSFNLDRKECCSSCRTSPCFIEENLENSLADLINMLKLKFKFKNPSISANVKSKLKTLYMPSIPTLEEKTRVNLNKTLEELGFQDSTVFIVADKSYPKAMHFQLKALNY